MRALDLIIIFGYLIGIVLFGAWFGRKQRTTSDYFLGDRSVPWWAVAFSIVATETSTITFISVPGIAFARGGNFQFLQLVFGYLLGRVVISLLFIPAYFRGELLTVYQLLDQRFGSKIKMVAASLFVVMRNIADGIRLLLTAIVLAAVYAGATGGARPRVDGLRSPGRVNEFASSVHVRKPAASPPWSAALHRTARALVGSLPRTGPLLDARPRRTRVEYAAKRAKPPAVRQQLPL
jgi:hypothetical protein